MTPEHVRKQPASKQKLRDLIEQDYENRGKDVFDDKIQRRITRDTRRVLCNMGLIDAIQLFTDY